MQKLGQYTRRFTAQIVARALTRISIGMHLGSGSVIGGRVALVIDPHLLEKLTFGRRVVLVSGTNGKTTTTRMIAYALSDTTSGALSDALGSASMSSLGVVSRHHGRSIEHLDVATSLSGSNLPAGIVSALMSSGNHTDAVIEVDEGYLPELIAKSHPEVVVLLNLSRDQLDRVNEVRMTSAKWRKALIDAFNGQPETDEKLEPTGYAISRDATQVSGQVTGEIHGQASRGKIEKIEEALARMPGRATEEVKGQAISELESQISLWVVANCDDPMVVWAASGIPESHVIWVSAGQRWKSDASSCPNCGGRINFTNNGTWSCECGFARPVPSVTIHDDKMVMDGRDITLSTSLPGKFNLSNAAMAVTAVSLLGKSPLDSVDRIARLTSVAGRFASIDIELVDSQNSTCIVEATVIMMLAKNPAGWFELIELLTATNIPLVIGINAKIADGLDPSWLWDVPFEKLAQRQVVATGLRGLDLAVRLSYAGVKHRHTADQLQAIAMGVGVGVGVGVGADTGVGVGADTGVDNSADVATSAYTRPPKPLIHYVGNYTAFQELRKVLSGKSPIHVNGLANIIEYSVLRDNHSGNGRREAEQGNRDKNRSGSRGNRDTRRNKDRGVTRNTTKHATRDSTLRIVSLYPDILGTYGDGGNAIILARRAELYGIVSELVEVHTGDDIPSQCDIYCIGGGEDAPQAYAAQLLRSVSARIALNRALSDGAAMLAVCAGYQIIGESFPASTAKVYPGVGLVPAVTVKTAQSRAVGEILCRSSWLGDQLLTGFENHAGRTVIGQEAQSLGRVLRGVGNGLFEDNTEGIVYGHIVGTYMHGPVLARNSIVADAILSMVTGGIHSSASAKLDDIEQAVRGLRHRLIERPHLLDKVSFLK